MDDGAADADQLAAQPHPLYSGGAESVRLGREPGIGSAQRAAVAVLLGTLPR